MRIKIKKTVLGEGYIFYVTVSFNNLLYEVRLAGKNESITAVINLSERNIELSSPIEFRGYINGLSSQAPIKTIKKLPLSKWNYHSVKDYISQ